MPIYLCRWPNGDCSIVAARNRESAIDMLDNEIGNAEGLPLFRMKSDVLINLRLRGDGRFELAGGQSLSSDLSEEVLSKAYPILNTVLMEAETARKVVTRADIARAVRDEKIRITAAKQISETQAGRRLQAFANVPASKADRIAREAGRKKGS